MKTICVTGANGNLGKEICEMANFHGYNVLKHNGRSEGDLTSELVVQNFANQLPKIDALICCVGNKISTDPLGQLSDFIKMINVNFVSAFLCCKYIHPKINVGGHIITIGSVDGCFGQSTGAMYAVSKSALHIYTRCLAKTLLGKVNVNCIAPGTLYAEKIKDVAETIVKLCDMKQISGQVVRIDNCNHTFPC